MALPVLAAAADPDMMNLVMPDASTVMEINLAKIMASPIGSTMREAFHQGAATQLKLELAKTKPPFQEQLAALADIDWSHEVLDIVVARGPGKPAPTLILVRSSLDLGRIQAMKEFSGEVTEFEGVPMLTSPKPEGGVFAFLDGSIVAIGPLNDVKAAIHRRGQQTVLPAALAAQVAQYKQDDIWLASTEIMTGPLAMPAAAKSPAGAQVTQFIEKVAGFNGGLRFSPDLDLSADLEARTEKGAGELLEGMRWLSGLAQSQARNAGQGGRGLEGLKFQLTGKHILFSLHVPEAQMRAGLQQMRTAQAAPAVAVPRPSPRVAPSSGLPTPPAGTIRVQSSDMGTVLLPVEKPQ
jgi:hypothetical protein